MDEWKKEYTVMYNALNSVLRLYEFSKKQKPSNRLVEEWKKLDYDKLRKLAMMYRAQWLKK